MPAAYKSRKKIAFEWLQMTDEERISHNLPIVKTKFIAFLGMRRSGFNSWEKEFYDPKNVYMRSHPMAQSLEVIDGEVVTEESVEISEDEKVLLARKVYDDAIKGGATTRDKELAVRMLGLLIEKHVVEVGLTADEIVRRNLAAERELKEWHRGRRKS